MWQWNDTHWKTNGKSWTMMMTIQLFSAQMYLIKYVYVWISNLTHNFHVISVKRLMRFERHRHHRCRHHHRHRHVQKQRNPTTTRATGYKISSKAHSSIQMYLKRISKDSGMIAQEHLNMYTAIYKPHTTSRIHLRNK